MHEYADRLAGAFVGMDEPLEGEFEARLAESSTLAFRVAYGVLRHRQDAEDVAPGSLRESLSALPGVTRPRTLSRLARAHDQIADSFQLTA